jgi:hypothetical protein
MPEYIVELHVIRTDAGLFQERIETPRLPTRAGHVQQTKGDTW